MVGCSCGAIDAGCSVKFRGDTSLEERRLIPAVRPHVSALILDVARGSGPSLGVEIGLHVMENTGRRELCCPLFRRVRHPRAPEFCMHSSG